MNLELSRCSTPKRLAVFSVFVFALNIAVGFPLVATQQSDNKSQNKQERQADKKAAPSGDPLQKGANSSVTTQGPIHVIRDPSPEDIQRETEDRLKPFWKKPEWVAIIVGVLAAAFAFLAFRAANRQAVAAEQQVGVMRKQMALSNYAHLDMRKWRIEIEPGAMLPRRIYICCDIVNTGNIPATIRSIECRRSWNTLETTIGPSAIIYPAAEPYLFRETAEWSDLARTTPATAEGTINPVAGTLKGIVRYDHAFDVRNKHFSMIFRVSTTGESAIERMEGAGNNDEHAEGE